MTPEELIAAAKRVGIALRVEGGQKRAGKLPKK